MGLKPAVPDRSLTCQRHLPWQSSRGGLSSLTIDLTTASG